MEKLSLLDPAIISACSAWTCPPTQPKRILAFSSLVTHRVVIIDIRIATYNAKKERLSIKLFTRLSFALPILLLPPASL